MVIHGGESSTRIRQLESQVESLTLQTVKLQRVNRLLKIDADNLIKEKTKGLEEQIAGLTLQNVRLQRANRLLMEELEDRTKEVNQIREDAIIKMNAVGPEYEYLVQMVNLLHRQVIVNMWDTLFYMHMYLINVFYFFLRSVKAKPMEANVLNIPGIFLEYIR